MSEKDERQNQEQAGGYPYQTYPYYYYPSASPAYYPMYNYQQYAQPQQQFTQPQTQRQAPQTEVQRQEHGMLPLQQSYIENILRLNQGKVATVYMTFENNNQWNAKVFRGRIEAAGRDHLILSDPDTDRRYLLLMVYLDYVTFDEEINYTYPFAENDQVASFTPR